MMKDIFYFMSKALFVLKILEILYFCPFFSNLFRFEKTSLSGIIMTSPRGLHKLALLEITQKLVIIKRPNFAKYKQALSIFS